jgi:sterol desaturase/sphingolipid hydroxylase (fatty acid hydroxylase superfamily)
MNKTTTVIISAGVFIVLFFLEKLFPLRRRTVALWRRLAINLVIAALTLSVVGLIVRPASDHALLWTVQNKFGLLGIITMPSWLAGVAGFLLLDLSFYYWHRANHTWPWLWRFHNVHHIDGDLDVTTAFRFHAVEIVFSAVFRVVQILALGVSVWTYAIYEVVFQAGTLFHHSNLRLPVRLEQLLSKIIVTPRMHAIHHSQVQREANSNYSTVFSWWDRLHRSLRLGIHQKDILIGVPAYTGREDRSLIQSLTAPFKTQKSYWLSDDGTAVTRQSAEARDRSTLE